MVAFVQHAGNKAASATSLTVTLAATGAGNCLIVVVSTVVNNEPVSGITLGGSSAGWSQVNAASQTSDETGVTIYTWINQAIAGGQTSLVVTIGGSDNPCADVYEVSGLTGAVLDKVSINPVSAGAAAWTSNASGTTTTDAEFVVGVMAGFNNAGGTTTITGPTSPWTSEAQLTPATGQFQLSGYQVSSTTGSFTFSGTSNISSPNNYYTAIVATFRTPAVPRAGQPVRAPIPQPFSRGRVSGNRGAPVQNPAPPGSGPKFYPLNRPAGNAYRAPGPFRKGRAYGNAGAPVRNPGSGPKFYPLNRPAGLAWRAPGPFRKGRTAGVAPPALFAFSSGPKFYPLNHPAGLAWRAPGPFRKGRTAGSAGAPLVTFPHGPKFYPLNHPAGNAYRAPGPFRKGRASGSPGAPLVIVPAPYLVQQVTGGGESDYGFSSAPITTTAGNGLVLFAGWDLHNAPTDAPVPALYPADSAGNYWYHLGTSPVGGYGSRCTIWCCPNARSVEWVSACMTAYANALAWTVCEIGNFPQFAIADVSASNFVNAGVPSVQVFTEPGSGFWQPPSGVSDVAAQCWAAGGGSTSNGFGGAGAGEYAADPSVAVTAGGSSASRGPASTLAASATATATTTWASNPSAGSKILVFVAGNAATPESVVDNGASPTAFTLDAYQYGEYSSVFIYRADSITLPASGSYAVTVTYASANSFACGGVAYTGVSPGGPVATSSGTASGTAVSSGSVTPTGTGNLYFGAFCDDSSLSSESITLNWAAGTEQFTENNGAVYTASGAADAITSGSQTAGWTLGDNVNWAAVIAAYSSAVFYPYTVGQGGAQGATWDTSASNGGDTTFSGNSVTVHAHGGKGALINTDTGQPGGTGSANAVHHDGGAGGRGSATAGGGGGASGGPDGTGTAGGNASGATPGAGGGAVTDGGPGGPGGAAKAPGNSPAAGPGGGAGTGGDVFGASTPPVGAPGADGQIILTYSVTSPTTLGMSATTTSADIAFAVIGAGNGEAAVTSAPSGWSALGSGVAIGGSSPDGMSIFPYWHPSVAQGAVLTPSWTVSPAAALSAVLGTIELHPTAPTVTNPDFPVLKVEIAQGFTPGDPTATPPTWTDITAWCISKDGDAFITVTYGQEYELATPEAGEMVIGVNNLTGAFTPGNTASPFYPYVVLGMPVRVSAYWDGSWYQIGYGYVERWPQEWPDLPQWGLSKLTCTDSVAVLNSTTMPSALQGDILADAPYTYFPLAEQYLSSVNGLTSASGPIYSYTSAETAGLIAANASRVNQKSAMYCDGGTEQMETGLALNLNGDQGTAAGTSSYSGSIVYTAPVSGPGVIYSDPSMPNPTNADGMSVEIWFIYDFAQTSGQGLTLFQAFGPSPSCYWPTTSLTPAASGPASFVAQIDSTTNAVQLILNGTTVSVGAFVPSASAQQLIVTFPPAGSSAVTVYLNGALLGTASLSAGETTAWSAFAAGPAIYGYSANPLTQNYVMGHGALYPYQLSAGRAASHYATGSAGASGSTVTQGTAQILSWGYLGIPRGGPAGFGPAGSQVPDGIEMGPFYSLSGSTAADGLNNVILSDGGMMYAAPSGVLTVLPRWALFNIAPSVTFGDAATGTEVPYVEGQAFDYDNTYLYNIIQVTRSDGSTTSITAQIKNTASQLAYFTRSALQQTISTTSDLDAYTLADWESGQYAQPALRVRSLEVDAASNPSVAFPDVFLTGVATVANVARNPVGGVPIVGAYLVQKVTHKVGPTMWRSSFEMSPYVQQSAVLATDTAGYNVLGNNALS